MKKRFVWLLIFLLFGTLMADNISVKASVNKKQLSVADRLEYTITIESDKSIKVAEPPAPQIENFTFVNVSSSSRSFTSIVNFKRQHQYSRSFHYYYLPKGEGNSKIASQRIKIDNNVYTTGEFHIQVVKDAANSQSQPNQSPFSPFSSFRDEDFWGGGNLGETTMQAEMDSESYYVGQPFVVSYYLYTDQMVGSFHLNDEQDYPGYGKSTYEQPQALNYEVINRQNKRLQRALIKRMAILPNQEGRLQLPTLSGRARIYEYGYLTKHLDSQPAYVNILALPQKGQPADFNGAIGAFKLSEGFSTEDISLGETISFSLRIGGRGNFNQFVNPVFKDDRAQISSPLVMDKLQGGIEGSRTLHYTIIPAEKGSYQLPTLSFSWFDTESGRYESYRSPEAEITVKSANVMSYFSGLLEGGKPKTMHPMMSRPAYPDYKSYLKRWWYWLLVCMILVGVAVAEYIAMGKIERTKDPAGYQKRRAERTLKRYLGEATPAARNGSKEFYQLAERGFNQFLKDKYGIAPGLSNPEKLELMQEKGLEYELIQKSAGFWEACNHARFSPEEIAPVKISEDLLMLRQLVGSFKRNKRRGK